MCFEAQLGIIEDLQLAYQIIDSREWQRVFLPEGIKGAAELKKASLDCGLRLFPKCADMIQKQKDADALFIAEYARRKNL